MPTPMPYNQLSHILRAEIEIYSYNIYIIEFLIYGDMFLITLSFLSKFIFNNKSKHEWKMHEVAFPSISFNPSMITPACILNSWIHFTNFLYALTGLSYSSMNLLYKRIEMNSDINLGVIIVCGTDLTILYSEQF